MLASGAVVAVVSAALVETVCGVVNGSALAGDELSSTQRHLWSYTSLSLPSNYCKKNLTV